MIDDKRLDELERLAKAATPGSWEKRWDGTLGRATVFADGLTITVHRRGYGNIAPEGAFIAAANPQTVLALVERLRLLEGIVQDVASAYERVEMMVELDCRSKEEKRRHRDAVRRAREATKP